MSPPFYCLMRGTFLIVGKTPDGDSVRFVADAREHLALLRYAHRVHVARDGSVQLRLEAADAPEAHYGEEAQPMSIEARDRLLGWLGFRHVEYDAGDDTLVTDARPPTVRGVVLSKDADGNGRPVAYVLAGDGADLPPDGEWLHLDDALLDRTLNLRLLADGVVYPSVYTSTPLAHRQRVRAVARAARDADLGIWARDETASFSLAGQRSIGPHGQLILPKLFRRCTDYLSAHRAGFRGDLVDWLVNGLGARRGENDRVILHESVEVRLSSLLHQRNRRVVFQANLLDITFVEK